jgi:hypothetical protein
MNKYVIFSAIIAGIITWLFMYIDARLFDTPKTKFTYFKGITFVSGLVAGIVYFMAPSSASSAIFQSAGAPMSHSVHAVNAFNVGGAAGDMLTGMPPF